jgi:hypothetical protein
MDKMKPDGWQISCRYYILIVVLLCFSLAACGLISKGLTTPLDPQQTAKLKPGLSVVYVDGFFRHIAELTRKKGALKKGRQGAPIPLLNHRFGKGEVFDSGRNRGVGMKMTGFINFRESGQYVLMAKSNDGIRVYVGDDVIVSDENVHSDRFSEPGSINISNTGWYPLEVLYFQRKGTATIEMHWKTPGANSFRVIPAEAYWHRSD